MSDSINLSKILLPKRRKDFLRRARLLDLIHQNIERKLTFISAPAGYGKTSVMLDFAAEVDAVVCWYHITPGDDDLGVFARYLMAAFRQKFKDFGEGLEDIFFTSGLDSKNLALPFLNEMLTKVVDFCVLCLDDYHIVGEAQPVVDFLEALLDHLPDQVRIVITSRGYFGIPAGKLFMQNEINTLGTDVLRFKVDEIMALVRQNFHYTMPLKRAEELVKRSDGWIVAIIMGLNARGKDKALDFENLTVEELYPFLAKEVVARESSRLQDFMFSVAILDEFTAVQANDVLGLSSAIEWIRELENRSLFIISVETVKGIIYQFHQLFLEFLRDQLARNEPDRKRDLHRRAAEWFKGQQSWAMAVHHKLVAGDRLEVAQWMDEAGPQLFMSGQFQLLTEWVESLSISPDLRLHAPKLLLNYAKVQVDQESLEAGERLLDLAEPIFRKQGDEDQVINALITRGTLYQLQQRSKEALEIIETVQSMLSHE